jgi:hypothetical protein
VRAQFLPSVSEMRLSSDAEGPWPLVSRSASGWVLPIYDPQYFSFSFYGMKLPPISSDNKWGTVLCPGGRAEKVSGNMKKAILVHLGLREWYAEVSKNLSPEE